MQARRLFIAGATGATGQVLLQQALVSQIDVVAHARPQSEGKLPSGCARVVLELTSQELAKSLVGCTTVVQLIGTMLKRFSSGDTYQSSDIGSTRLLLEAARECGTVDHVVLLSSVGAGAPRGAYLQAKAEAEQLVRDSGLPWTTLRPSAFSDRPGAFLPGLATVTRLLGLDRYRPITLTQLASALLHCAVDRAPINTALEGKELWRLVR